MKARTWTLSILAAAATLGALHGDAWANTIVPLTPMLHPGRLLPTAAAFVAVVVLEALLLRHLERLPLGEAAWKAAVVNLASSAVGSLPYFTTHDVGRHEPSITLLFAVTVLVEVPLLRWLLDERGVGWRRATGLGLLVNVTSYLALGVFTVVAMVGAILWTGHVDAMEVSPGARPDLLRGAAGALYTAGGPERRAEHLRAFDLASRTARELPGCEIGAWPIWHVAGAIAAIGGGAASRGRPGDPPSDVRVLALPTCRVVATVPEAALAAPGEIGVVHALRVSPDGAKLAALVHVDEVLVDGDGDFDLALGPRCRILVFDARSGATLAAVPRFASGDLGWRPDGEALVFSSLDDESLYHGRPRPSGRRSTHGVGRPETGRFASSLYAFTLSDGSVRRFASGREPTPNPARGTVIVRREDAVEELDPSGRVLRHLPIERLSAGPEAVSPDGRLVVVRRRRHDLFRSEAYAAVDLDDPTRWQPLPEGVVAPGRLGVAWGASP